MSRHANQRTFLLTLGALLLMILTLVVTMVVEVPIVKQIVSWRVEALPEDWESLLDRWGAFHVIRVVGGKAGLALLVVAAVFGG